MTAKKATKRLSSIEEIPSIMSKLGRPGIFYLPGNASCMPTVEKEIQRQSAQLIGWRGFQLLSMLGGWETVFRNVRMATPFIGKGLRKLVNAGGADFIPCHLSELWRLLDDQWCPDVAFFHVSPFDEHGVTTLGVDAGISHFAYEAALRKGTIMIAVVNKQMPRFHVEPTRLKYRGKKLMTGCPAHFRDFDYYVEIDEPIIRHKMGVIDEVSRRIGENVAKCIPNGACVQLGIGGIPDAVTVALRGHHGLGLHSELASNGALDLIERGVITGGSKSLLRGKHVIGFALGDEKMYAALSDERFAILPQRFVNDPRIIGRNVRMHNVNSALAVTFFGDVCASTRQSSEGMQFYSGMGGAFDFALGANMSEGGCSIIALPSTYRDNSGRLQSRICDMLPVGSHMTAGNESIRVFATEWGAVDTTGLTIRDRLDAMISIAHPDFRRILEIQASHLPGTHRTLCGKVV